MSKSKKESLTKAQKEQEKQYNEYKKIYLEVTKSLTDEQANAFNTVIGVFKENYATDQSVQFASWLSKDTDKEAIYNSYIKFRQFQFENMRKEMANTSEQESTLKVVN